MPVATRLSTAGTLLVNGEFDEPTLGSGSISLNGAVSPGQYLSVPSSTIGLSGQSFTIEGWFYPTDFGKTGYSSAGAAFIFSSTNTSALNGGNFGFQFFFNGVAATSLTSLGIYYNNGNSSTFSFAFQLNTWYHIALTKNVSTNTFIVFVNGNSIGSVVNSSTWTDNSPYTIGRSNQSGYERPFTGLISNFRIVRGTALYTSTFAPPTSILPAVANTSLLLNVTNAADFIKDNGPNNFTVTNVGSATFNASNPYNTTSTKFRTTSNTVFAGTLDEFTGAPVVDSSLKLWLDAAQTSSYSGTGSTWTDLSGNGNNGTLVNAPTFISTDGGGCIQLDGTNDHITLPVTGFAPPSLTIDYWIKRISDNGYFWLIDNSDNPELRMLFTSSGKLQIYFYDDGAYFSTALSSTTFSTGSWYNITATLTNGSQNVYINGNQEIITTTGVYTGGPSGNAGEHTLGTYNRPGVGYGGYANVRIGSYKFYNRVLTAAEITQNYNALQSRYGLASITATQMPVVQRQQSSGTLLVNGEFDEFTGAPVVDNSLLLWLDAGQTSSYSGTGTTWTDLSGSGTNGTLTSGPTYNASKGGSIVFDGVDDLVTVSDKGNLPVFTVEAWVNFISVPTNLSFPAIIANVYTGSPAVLNFSLGFNGTDTVGVWDGKIKIGFYDGTWRSTDGIIPTTNTWYHLVGTYNGSTLSFYINSTLSYTKSYVGTPSSSGAGIRIGRRWDSANYINGYIPLVRLYNRALSSDEITTNFNALRGRYGI